MISAESITIMIKQTIKKYVRALSWRLHNYTENWFDLNQIVRHILNREYEIARIKLSKLRDDFGDDPRLFDIENELDIAEWNGDVKVAFVPNDSRDNSLYSMDWNPPSVESIRELS